MSIDLTTETVVVRLRTDLQRLREEHKDLMTANRLLLSWGITSGSTETRDRLRAIRCEADTIAARLHSLGAIEDATRASLGWAILPAPTATAVWS